MARKFNPKSKILGRYFNEAPLGLKEINSFFSKPLYTYSHNIQYGIVAILLLINKRQENLNRVINNKLSFKAVISLIITDDFKATISTIRGISEYKRSILFDLLFMEDLNYFLLKINSINKNFNKILKSKEKDLHLFKERYDFTALQAASECDRLSCFGANASWKDSAN